MNYNFRFKKPHKHIFLPLSIVVILLTTTEFVTGQKTITLSQVINSAFANRKNIQASRSDQVIRQLQTDALRRKYWPQVNVEYTYLYNPILQTSILPIGAFNSSYPADATKNVQIGTKWSQTAGITVLQSLFDLSISRQINEGRLQQQIAATAQTQTEYELAYTVAQVYIDIAMQQNKIRSAIADTNRTWVSYRLLQDRFDQKRLLKSELNKGKMNLNNALQQYNDALSQLTEDKVYLLFLIGQNEIKDTDMSIDTTFFKNDSLPYSNMLKNTDMPELQQLDLKYHLCNLQTKSENAKYLPAIGFKSFLGANQYAKTFNPASANSWFGSSYIGIDFKYPILFGENRQKNIKQLQIQGQQYRLLRDDKEAQYLKDAVTASLKMKRLGADLKAQQENISLSIESLAIVRERVSEGQESAYTLNTEEANLQKLSADYQTNKKQYWLFLLDYLKASGNLSLLWKQ